MTDDEFTEAAKKVVSFIRENYGADGCGELGKSSWCCNSCRTARLADDLETFVEYHEDLVEWVNEKKVSPDA